MSNQWFLDFEAYRADSKIIIKELCILKDGTCYNYHIVGSKSLPIDNFQTYQFQYNLHRLEWGFGDYKFNDVIEDIALKLKSDTVYIKGNEKFKYMCDVLPSVNFVELENVPSFKHLNNCLHERCEVRHGNHCARRKAYELKNYMLRENKN